MLRSRDGGASRETIFDRENAYALAVSPDNEVRLALASEKGLYISGDGGGSWQLASQVPQSKLSSLAWPTPDALYIGAWESGAYLYEPKSGSLKHVLPDHPAVHLAFSGEKLLVGTWARGLAVLESQRA